MTAIEAQIHVDGRRERGDRTRRSILDSAARLANVEGLEGLSIGRLAEVTGISKSGLYAHFGSKEELQLATIDFVLGMYERDVMAHALREPTARARLLRFASTFLDYVRDGPFAGGCFFIGSFLDPATRRGRVRQRLADVQRAKFEWIEQNAREAQEVDGVASQLTPSEITFQFDSILVGGNTTFVLFQDAAWLEASRSAIRRLLTVDAVRTRRRS
jgi:AcrR family transcriptional regulator